MPKPDHWTIFGYPVSFIGKTRQELFDYKGMTEKIPTLQLDEEEQAADGFANQIGFRMKFLRRQFTFRYHSIKDILNMLGGILKIFKGTLSKFGVYMTIAFFIWFMIKVTQSFKEDLQFYKCDHIEKKLPLYRQAMLELRNQRKLLDEDNQEIEADIEEINDLLGDEKAIPPPPPSKEPEKQEQKVDLEEKQLEELVDQLDHDEEKDEESHTPSGKPISSDGKDIIIAPGPIEKTPEKEKEIVIDTPKEPA